MMSVKYPTQDTWFGQILSATHSSHDYVWKNKIKHREFKKIDNNEKSHATDQMDYRELTGMWV